MKYADWGISPRLNLNHFKLASITVGEKWQGRCHCNWKSPLFWNIEIADQQTDAHVQYYRRWR